MRDLKTIFSAATLVVALVVSALPAAAQTGRVGGTIKDQAGDGVLLVDAEDLRFVEFNDAACRMLGHDRTAFAALRLGAGRERAEDVIDPSVGIAGIVKVGERVASGAPLAVLHANDARRLAEARALLADAFTLGDAPVTPPPLVAEVIGG